jgi:hypothetical protein
MISGNTVKGEKVDGWRKWLLARVIRKLTEEFVVSDGIYPSGTNDVKRVLLSCFAI